MPAPAFPSGDLLAALRLDSPRPDRPSALVGLEHEYSLSRDGLPLDFRDVIHGLAIPGRRLDPGDTNAYRCRSGLALTCDEAEAEIASPPVTVAPGFARAIEEWAATGRMQLAEILPSGVRLEGYSTHISAALPQALGEAVARLYARTFAPALALILEGPASQGIYIRPRPGRLELCGEFVDGARLGAVAAFVAGSVRACALAITDPSRAPCLPPPLSVSVLPCVERHGLRVLRTATGPDLYAAGRSAHLPLEAGGTISGQRHLELAVRAARQALGRDASRADFAVLKRMVSGALPLGVEGEPARVATSPMSPRASWEFGAVIEDRRWPGFTLAPLAATWDFTVFRLSRGGTIRYLNVPRAALAAFMRALDAGRLDAALDDGLSSPAGAVLARHEQTRELATFDSVGELTALLAPEREPPGLAPALALDSPETAPRIGKTPAAAARPGKLAETARPWKVLAPWPAATPQPMLSPNPPTPVLPPVLPPARALPSKPFLVATAAVIAGLLLSGAVVALQVSGDDGAGAQTPPTFTPAATEHPVESATPPSPTAAAAAASPTTPPSPSPSPSATSTPAPPTATAPAPTVAGAVATPVPTPTARPTETPVPTPHPTDVPPPTPTATSTPTPTLTPTPRATATPTATPTTIIVPPPPPPPTAKPGCTPVPGATC